MAKIKHPDHLQDVERVSTILQQMDSPNILKLVHREISMEYCDYLCVIFIRLQSFNQLIILEGWLMLL